MATTQKDIADRLNISRGLVGRVLNGDPGKWASEEMTAKILTTAREMNYHPSAAGRHLKNGRSNNIALTYRSSDEGNVQSYLAMLIESVAERLGPLGYRLAVQAFPNAEAIVEHLETVAQSRSCDAALLPDFQEEAAERLARLDFPFVVTGRFEKERPEWIQADFHHEEMMRIAVRRLRQQGHERIGYIGFSGDAPFIHRLREGFESAMTAEGGIIPAGGIAAIDTGADLAQERMERWLALPLSQRPSAAVVGGSDLLWHGLESALLRRGILVHEGAGGFPLCGVSDTARPLLFGQGFAFCSATFAVRELGAMIADELLLPLLKGESIARTARLLTPPLTPIRPLATESVQALIRQKL